MLAKEYRIKKTKDFKRIYKKGKSLANKYLVIYYIKNNSKYSRFGFSVSKKIGNAVQRNRVKRLLREVCRNNYNSFDTGYDIVYIARVKIKGTSYNKVENEVLKLANRVNIIKKG